MEPVGCHELVDSFNRDQGQDDEDEEDLLRNSLKSIEKLIEKQDSLNRDQDQDQEAIRKLGSRLLGKPGILKRPEIPTCPLGRSNLTIPHQCVKVKDKEDPEEITDDESDDGPPQTNRPAGDKKYVQFHAAQTHSLYLPSSRKRQTLK